MLVIAFLTTALASAPADGPRRVAGLAGAAVSLMGWHRAADHAALASVSAVGAVRHPVGIGATFEVLAARSTERNDVLRITSVPLRLSATVDGTLRRGGIGFSAGTGPVLALLQATVDDDRERYSGWTASPGWRILLSVDGRLAGPLSWRLHGGATARRGGIDADLGAGVVVRFGDAR